MGHKNALLSAYDKSGLEEFARALAERDWNLYASQRTASHLAERKIPVQDVASLIGKPILGHRVMTLSREVFAGILADPGDAEEMYDLGLRYFDVVYVNLYPLKAALRGQQLRTRQELQRMVDFGGSALLSAAAYGNRLVICRPDQFDRVLHFIDHSPLYDEQTKNLFTATLAAEATEMVSDYAATAARFYQLVALGAKYVT